SPGLPSRSPSAARSCTSPEKSWTPLVITSCRIGPPGPADRFLAGARVTNSETICIAMANRSNHSLYLIKSLVHASQVLAAFRSEGEILRLRDVVARTGFNKSMCFRLLYTLHACGFLEKVGENQYRAVSDIRPNRRYRVGYASQGQDSSF